MSLPQSPKRTSGRNRLPVSLSHILDQKLLGYVAAASAAGVGLVALAKPSQAEVVYTPTNQLIKPFATLDLDLNNDGVTDFVIQNVYAVCIETSERKECSSFISPPAGISKKTP